MILRNDLNAFLRAWSVICWFDFIYQYSLVYRFPIFNGKFFHSFVFIDPRMPVYLLAWFSGHFTSSVIGIIGLVDEEMLAKGEIFQQKPHAVWAKPGNINPSHLLFIILYQNARQNTMKSSCCNVRGCNNGYCWPHFWFGSWW